MTACRKHMYNPVKGYNPCPGCEIERERQKSADQADTIAAQQQILTGLAEMLGVAEGDVDGLIEAVEDLKEQVEEGSKWFNSFSEVESWMLEREIWNETHIDADCPAKTLLNGLDALLGEVEMLKKDAERLMPALEEAIKSLEIISQQAGESHGLSTFTQIKQYALDWVRTVRKDLAAGEAG